MKERLLKQELEYINDEKIKESAKKLLCLVPDYFFKVPASSTGKYHPSFSQGDGGLLRHTKVALKIAKDLLELEYMSKEFTEREKDLLIFSVMFHDSMKLGNQEEKYTRFDHPILAASFIENNKAITSLTEEDIKLVERCISSHMGEWNKTKYSKTELPKPNDKYEFFVHMCDYLSSKKYLDVKFDEENNISI